MFLITQVVRKPRLMLIPSLSGLGFLFLFSGSGKVEGWGGGGGGRWGRDMKAAVELHFQKYIYLQRILIEEKEIESASSQRSGEKIVNCGLCVIGGFDQEGNVVFC